MVVKYHIYTCTHTSSSTVVQSHIDCLICECIILYHTVIYPLRRRITSSPPQQYYLHRTSISHKSWNIISASITNCSPTWRKPVSSRMEVIATWGSSAITKTVSITDESSAISGTNITDHHIAMVRDEVSIQTERNTYMHSRWMCI